MPAPHLFRTAFSRLASGVCVVTGHDRAAKNQPDFGITLSSVTSVSIDPALLLFCLSNQSRRIKFFKKNAIFNIQILSDKQKNLADIFSSVVKADWKKIPHQKDKTGLVELTETLAVFHCHVHSLHHAGDHTLILGQIENIKCTKNAPPPLLYAQRCYHKIGRKISEK